MSAQYLAGKTEQMPDYQFLAAAENTSDMTGSHACSPAAL
jgi:hypothetical protein